MNVKSYITIEQKIQTIKDQFSALKDWQHRYKHLIAIGKSLAPMPDLYKIDKNLVKGCQSKVWLHAELKKERIFFYADSDASIVKGLISLLLAVYQQSTPREVLETRPTFISDIGLSEHLSMSRANGLNSMIKQIALYALVFSQQVNKGE